MKIISNSTGTRHHTYVLLCMSLKKGTLYNTILLILLYYGYFSSLKMYLIYKVYIFLHYFFLHYSYNTENDLNTYKVIKSLFIIWFYLYEPKSSIKKTVPLSKYCKELCWVICGLPSGRTWFPYTHLGRMMLTSRLSLRKVPGGGWCRGRCRRLWALPPVYSTDVASSRQRPGALCLTANPSLLLVSSKC